MSKKFFAVILTAAVMAAPVLAQSASQASPTNTATAGLFSTDVENSMNVFNYSKVEFDKLAGFLGYNDIERPVSIGFAKNFGDIYVGTWFNGNFLRMSDSYEEDITTNYNLTSQLATQTMTTTTYNNKYSDSNNRIYALIGAIGMGFKVGFLENLRVYYQPDESISVTDNFNNSTKIYSGDVLDFSQISGTLMPSIEWGMNIEADNLTIRPRAYFEFEIYRNRRNLDMKAMYTTIGGSLTGNDVTNRSGQNQNYLSPAFNVGAEIGIPSGRNHVTLTAGLFYGFDMNVYKNSYDVSGFTGDVKGVITNYSGSTIIAENPTFKTTTDAVTLTLADRSRMVHSISPSFKYEHQAIGNLKLAVSAQVPFRITVQSDSDLYENYFGTSKTTYKNSGDSFLNTTTNVETTGSPGVTDTTAFNITPRFNFGASYAFFPNRFTVNAGVSLYPLGTDGYTKTTRKYSRSSIHPKRTTTVLDSNGNEISKNVELLGIPADEDTVTASASVTNVISSFSAGVMGGFKFNFTENMAIDMAVSAGIANSNFTFDISNVRVMFTLKF